MHGNLGGDGQRGAGDGKFFEVEGDGAAVGIGGCCQIAVKVGKV